jgi:hypothetical protein
MLALYRADRQTEAHQADTNRAPVATPVSAFSRRAAATRRREAGPETRRWLGGSAADGAIDNAIANATKGDDTIHVAGSRAGADATGLATAVSIKHTDPTDVLSFNSVAGHDNVLVNDIAGLMQLLIDGTPAA